jgi:hypothetical protein
MITVTNPASPLLARVCDQAVLIDADDPHPVQASCVGGHDHLGGLHSDGVDGVPGEA